jgi:predicted enzyme related to lactoylglutathione lyase
MKVNQLILNVNSPDPERLAAFYRYTVQLVPEGNMGPSAFKAGGDAVFIIDGHSKVAGSASGPERVLIDFMVDDLAAEHARLEAAGVPVQRTMGREEWGGVISTFVDPDGNFFQLMEFKPRQS